MENPITEEIRAIRHDLASRFDNNLDRIVEDLRRQQRESGREYIQLPKRPARPERTANKAVNPSGGSGGL